MNKQRPPAAADRDRATPVCGKPGRDVHRPDRNANVLDLGRQLLSGRFRAILLFTLTSGVGWLIDIGLFTWLTAIGLAPLSANLISAGTAVTYVFLVSTRRIFSHDHSYMVGKFLFYLAYQIAAVFLASLAIDVLYRIVGGHPLLAKVLVTPVTLYMNFIFMAYLLERRFRFF
jgi:hypothetical protein